MEKVIFLDRDGVINKKADEHDYIKKVEEFHLLNGVAEAISLLNKNLYKVIVVTNQRGIARGMLTEQALTQIHNTMKTELKKANAYIDAIYYCSHGLEDKCNCRKPKIGMFLQAALDFNINKNESFMVGDSISDIEAGIAFGVKSIFIGTSTHKVLCAKDLLSAVTQIILR